MLYTAAVSRRRSHTAVRSRRRSRLPDAVQLLLVAALEQRAGGLEEWTATMQHVVDLLGDRHLYAEALRQAIRCRRRREALGDGALAGEIGGRVDALGEALAERAVARQVAGAGEHEIADAGHAEEGEGIGAQRHAEPRDLDEAAGDERGAGVVAERQAV